MLDDRHEDVLEEDAGINHHAELALLAALMRNNDAYHLVSSFLEPEHFGEHQHARIYHRIGEMIVSGEKADELSLVPFFQKDMTMLDCGGTVYLARIAASVITVVNAPGYAEAIINAWRHRRTKEIIEEMRVGTSGYRAPAETAGMLRTAVAELVEPSNTGGNTQVSLSSASNSVVTRLNDALMNGVVADDYSFAGSSILARAIGGWRRGRLYILGGRPSMGKTTVGQSWLLRTAGKGYPVAFFSLEMGTEELVERCLTDLAWSRDARVEYQDLSRSAVNAEGLERICAASERLATLPFHIDDRAGLTLPQVRVAAARLASRLRNEGKRLEVVCIDHMGLLRASERYSGNKVAETEEISAGLKAMAKELDVAVLALVQLSRATEGRDNKRPTLADLRWSGAIEQDADCVMFAYRESYYLERQQSDDMDKDHERILRLSQVRNKLEIIIAKQRGGACPVLEFYTDMGCAVVRDALHG